MKTEWSVGLAVIGQAEEKKLYHDTVFARVISYPAYFVHLDF